MKKYFCFKSNNMLYFQICSPLKKELNKLKVDKSISFYLYPNSWDSYRIWYIYNPWGGVSKSKLIRDFISWKYKRKLHKVANFIEKHILYPVNLDKELLKIWKQ